MIEKDMSPKEIKKLVVIFIKEIEKIVVVFVIGSIFYITKPSYHSHTQTVSTKLSQTIVGDNKDRGFIWGLIDKGVGRYSELELVKYGWKVDDLLIITVGSIKYKGKKKILSVGILSKVFVRELR